MRPPGPGGAGPGGGSDREGDPVALTDGFSAAFVAAAAVALAAITVRTRKSELVEAA
jgi:hypothetical protein